MRRVVLVVAATVGLLLSLPVGAAAHVACPGEPGVFGEFHADLAMGGDIPGHLPGEHFGFAGLCLLVEALPDVNPGT